MLAIKRDMTLRSSYHQSSALGILTLLAVLLLAPCLHAQGTDVVEPHASASHATDQDPCCFDAYSHRLAESHPPCANAITIARGATDRETVQPVTSATPVPVGFDSAPADIQRVRLFREERDLRVHTPSLYTLHRQYRL
jgi:hypothetical protein